MDKITICKMDGCEQPLPIICLHLPQTDTAVTAVPTWCFLCTTVGWRTPSSINNMSTSAANFKFRQVFCRFGKLDAPTPGIYTAYTIIENPR